MASWSPRRISTTCEQINRSLAKLTDGIDPEVAPVEVEVIHFATKHKHSTLMRQLGLVETIRQGGGPQHVTSLGRGSSTTTRYRINRRSITENELREFVHHPSKR